MRRARNMTLMLGLVLLLAAAAHAATIRGKLVHENGQAAAGYQVSVSNAQGRSSPARVGADGMYYIYNIAPGTYDLEIWVPGTPAPRTYRINVVDPYTDVPQLNVP